MTTPAPPGLRPIFLRGVTCEKFGLKTGEGVNDVVDYKYIPKEDIIKEIQVMGVMSDFEPAKKQIEGYATDQILLVTDREQKYGETFLICYTDEARDEYMRILMESQEALREQMKAEMQAEEERRAAEFARLNVVYEDKPITPRPWVRENSSETDAEIALTSQATSRELYSIEVSRPKRFTRQKVVFSDKTAETGGVAEFRAYKDPNFKVVRESDIGIQVAPTCLESGAQTTWFRSVNKAIQYEAASIGTDTAEGDNVDSMLAFLEKATVQVELALQQNESVDIFNETFRLLGDDDVNGGAQAENELRELKNFADPTYSKFKALAAIDWVPKVNSMVAVSAVRNISFDQRIPIIGQTHTSYVLLWDFRLLVKPLILMKSHHEIFTFRFNRVEPNLVAGGCITGQVVLWETSAAITAAQHKNNRGSSSSSGGSTMDQEEEDLLSMPVSPKYVSHVDFSHKKCVADLFWLPPTTQINYRGQLVGEEHLDGKSYQFVTIAGDGMIMVWDIRYEQIFNDELRHVGRVKHVPTEKSNNKEAGLKPLWAPIFKAHLKRLEGVGELSLCKISPTTVVPPGSQVLNKPSHFAGDSRSQFIIATEEGDVIFTDLSARKVESHTNKEEEDEEEAEFSCVKWITVDHPRPSVCLQESPFFPQVVLSISDWNFHLWKIGEDQPLFVSPLSPTYLTAGAWSTTRPAVLYIACADGQILVWDFTDSSFRPSIELKATHSKIASMEFLSSSTASRHQLLAVGDDVGTLHIFEVPRNLTRPVHKEEAIMGKFLERELQRIEFARDAPEIPHTAHHDLHADTSANTNQHTNAAPSRTGTADLRGASRGTGAPGTADSHLSGAGLGDTASAEKEALSKEEEDFLKMESIFITELGLHKDQLPAFIRPPEPTAT